MQLFFIGWNRNHSGGGENSEEEKSYGRACDISMPVISRSHMSTKIQPTVHRAEVYLETCLSSLRVQSCHVGSECAIEERRLGTGFMTWSCRTMVCLCPRLVCSAAQLWMKCTFLKFTVQCSPLKAPFLCLCLSTGDWVSSLCFTCPEGSVMMRMRGCRDGAWA